MLIAVGYELEYRLPQPTPMILMLNIHYSRTSDLLQPDQMVAQPSIPLRAYRDGFGNWCTRLVAPTGHLRISSQTVVRDSGAADVSAPAAEQRAVEDLPEETLVFRSNAGAAAPGS